MNRRAFTSILMAGALAVGTALLATPAAASGWHHGQGDGALGFLLRKTNPTTDQKHAIAAILTAHKTDLEARAAALSQARRSLIQLHVADAPDAQALGAGYDQAAAAAKAMGLLRLQVRQEIMAVLTADQRATLSQSRDKFLQHMQEHQADRQGGLDRMIEKLSR